MRKLLRDLSPGQVYAIQFRSQFGDQYSEWSQVQRLTTTNDLIAPSQPTNLSWFDSGTSIIATWNKVTTEASPPPSLPKPLKDFRYYRCNVSDGTTNVDFYPLTERFELTSQMNIAAFGSLKTVLTLNVYAVDMTYNESSPATANIDVSNPPVPSTPVLSTYFGSLLVEWNGKSATNTAMPGSLDYVEVHVGTSNTFTADATTIRDRIVMNSASTTQRSLLTGLTNGTQYWVKLVAVNMLKKKSAASAVSNGITKANLSGLDIANGQISTAQINFTAKDIGGANAYYPATTTAMNALTGVKNGDIAYVTGSGYATYRYNGTSWAAASEIGVLSGTKILAGTVTADAVGTNELITAKANIALGIIDTAHIDFLSAAKITTGVLQSQFSVNYGGVTQPAWQFDVNGNAVLNNVTINGQAVIGQASNSSAMNTALALKSYNYVQGVSGWAVRGDGTVEFQNATLRGIYRTAYTGRRIEVGAAGSTGSITLYGPSDSTTYGRLQTFTSDEEEGIPSKESIRLGMFDSSTWTNWNHIFFDSSHSFWLQTSKAYIFYGGQSGVNADFVLYRADNKGTPTTRPSTKARMWFTDVDDRFYFPTGGEFSVQERRSDGELVRRLDIDDGDSNMRFHKAAGRGGFLWMDNLFDATWAYKIEGADDEHIWWPGVDKGRMSLTPGTATGSTAKLKLFNSNSYGILIKGYYSGAGILRAELRSIFDDEFERWYASGYDVQSDAASKTDISQVPTSELLVQVQNTEVRKYRRKNRVPVADATDEAASFIAERSEPGPVEIGLIAQEAPEQIVMGEEGNQGIDLYQMGAMTWGAVQELSKQIAALNNRITQLEQQGKGKK